MVSALLSSHHWVRRVEKTGESGSRDDSDGGQQGPACQEDGEDDETDHVSAGPPLNQGRRPLPLPGLWAELIWLELF